MAALAVKMISKYGQSMTLRSYSSSGDEWNPSLTETDTAVTGVLGNYNDGLMDGTLIQKDDKYVLLDSSVNPTEADKIVIDGVVFSIAAVNTINPGGTKVFHKLQVRA